MPEEFIQKDGYQVHTRWNDMLFGGSALVGQVDLTYDEIVELLGEPMQVNGKMISRRWLIKFNDELDEKGRALIATIFNYKDLEVYNVGGFSLENLERVKKLFKMGVVS